MEETNKTLIRRAAPAVRIVLFCGAVVLAVYTGIRLRDWWYPASETYRFEWDIENAWRQGSSVYVNAVFLQHDGGPLRWRSFWRSYLDRYDTVMSQRPAGNYLLDYPPARLLIMSLWVWHEAPHAIPYFSRAANMAGPLLWVDTTAELCGAVLAYLIVHLVLRRNGVRQAHWLALLAAMLLWFDPSVLLDRVWPQWDSWVLPFYLGAAYLALNRRWLIAGASGVGMMFKGQVLCTAAIFALWPLFQARWCSAIETVVSMLLGAMICTSPWLVRTPAAAIVLFVLLVGTGVGLRYVRRGWRILTACSAIAVSIFLAGACVGGSFAWWFVPFAYATRHYLMMGVGTPTNLPALLAHRWGLGLKTELFAIVGITITLRTLLVALYAATLVACGFGLARADLRNDRRVLIGLATPWILMFTFMPQMHERYLYWGAAISALAAGVSVGATLLHVALTLLSCVAMANWLTRQNQWPELTRFVQGMFPDCGWAVVLLALIFLYLSIVPTRRNASPIAAA